MDSTPISTAFLLASLLTVSLLEAAAAVAAPHLHLSRLWLIAVVRTVQVLAVMILARVQAGGPQALGLDPKTWRPGLRKGLVWSAAFAAAAALLFLGLFAAGQNPLMLVHSPLPADLSQQVLFFFVGGIVAPVAEEVVFRGLIFGYLRRWGLPVAVLISTALFAALHLPGIPVTQIAGGVVFALAYQRTGSLITPMVIHMLGNLAIFTLSLPWLQKFAA